MKVIVALLLLCTALGFAQGNLQGKIVATGNGGPLSYVNIGIGNKGIGTVSDREGRFNLRLETINDSARVVFSHLGYVPQVHSIASLIHRDNTIFLVPDTTQLKEVVVKPKALKQRTIGRKGKGLGLMHHNFYSAKETDVDDRLSKEIGMEFTLRKDCLVQALNFNITSNEFKSLKFRINFYRIRDGLPAGLLNTQDIIFDIGGGALGWFRVDLSDYDLYLKKDLENIGVTLQWLESVKKEDESRYFSLSAAMGTSRNFFYREKAMDRWVKGKSKLSFYLEAACN